MSAYTLSAMGVCEDALHGRRDEGQIQERGRWLSLNSVRRYKKLTRAQAELSKYPPKAMALGMAMADPTASLSLARLMHDPALAASAVARFV